MAETAPTEEDTAEGTILPTKTMTAYAITIQLRMEAEVFTATSDVY